ncbi:hypothetical protein Taro_018685 [Colocasia esculenta]|uniref:Uncharacterized protein n=1 Tax=Colocasia esculenta TaxID=4460 RepID=A0A843V374_COLES|nr:hypothetical protein [Colocasia esculenta]
MDTLRSGNSEDCTRNHTSQDLTYLSVEVATHRAAAASTLSRLQPRGVPERSSSRTPPKRDHNKPQGEGSMDNMY